MSWADLFKALDDRGLVDLRAVARELAELGYGAPGGRADGSGDGKATEGAQGGETASEGTQGPSTGVSR